MALAVTGAEGMTSVVEGGREWRQQPRSGAWLGLGCCGWPAGAVVVAAAAVAAAAVAAAAAAAVVLVVVRGAMYVYHTYVQAYICAQCTPITNKLPWSDPSRLDRTST